uniref:Uncharacterized protein LOC114914360 n=1 Tax=Elaeis guineensis var. tenera TaxID=51953 RepID=A0A8N4IGM0_ELAGV|nr:uncharacterized protein LOC114914360 [Elaeis guineensis]
MKMHEEQSVHDYCLIMIKDLEELEKLDISIDKELQIDLILQSLIDSYGQFIVNFYMNKIQCTLTKLMNMLIIIEGTLKSSRGSVLSVERISFKKKSTRKNKKSEKKKKVEGKMKEKKVAPKKKAPKKGKYFHCNSDGHWKWNCPVYLTGLKNKREDEPSEGS